MISISSDVNAELSSLKTTAELRGIPENEEKVIFILQNYDGDFVFTLTELCAFFDVNRRTLQRRMASIFLGYSDHSQNKIRYLAPVHDDSIAEIIVKHDNSLKAIDVDEIPAMVISHVCGFSHISLNILFRH